jgi:hypothetical protein
MPQHWFTQTRYLRKQCVIIMLLLSWSCQLIRGRGIQNSTTAPIASLVLFAGQWDIMYERFLAA